MALDGIAIAGLTAEFNEYLLDGRIYKIAQPEPDELLLTVRSPKGQYRLLISAGASLPLIYLTEEVRTSPLTAPGFCMLLRKHIQNGRIVRIFQPSLERCVHFEIEHYDELGDICRKSLIVEIMGKYSNIIFCDSSNTVIDSIKRISNAVSSVREILPGRPYFLPDTTGKHDPLTAAESDFRPSLLQTGALLGKAVYSAYTGISPVIAEEICFRAGIDSSVSPADISDMEMTHLFHTFRNLIDEVKEHAFYPAVYYRGEEPVEFSAVRLTLYSDLKAVPFDSVSGMTETYYLQKETRTRMRQKSSDLRRIVQTDLERCRRKYDLQTKQLKDTGKRDKFRIYGELINTYGYSLEPQSSVLCATDYYSGKEVEIPLDPSKNAAQNAQQYFDRYNKMKRTYDALSIQLSETSDDIAYLESVAEAIEIASSEADLAEIRSELHTAGFIRSGASAKHRSEKSRPMHYRTSDGFDIFIGKNNLQNEELTFKTADGGDWWFHAKKMPGSHVIVKNGGKELSDAAFEEAARLAAHYSAARSADKAEVDYVERKHVRKVNGGRPGFVIYHTNYSMTVPTNISDIERIE